MCGIVGYVGNKNAVNSIMSGLKSLEYRGYDSAGIAYYDKEFKIIKAEGKLNNLEKKINGLNSNIGIGHTRWATHGKPTVENAHPHKVGKFTIVHNGIIENYDSLRKLLVSDGYTFKSETDTEVVAALLDKFYSEKADILKVISEARKLLIGSYAFGILCDDYKDSLFALRKDSPLIVGIGENENFIASDVPAILKYTNKYILIDEGEIVEISNKVKIYDEYFNIKEKEILTFDGDLESAEKGGYEHFMLKEIHEEPNVFKNATIPFLKFGLESLLSRDFSKYTSIDIVGCGSAYHAGLVGKSLIECYGMRVNVYVASEYRYQKLFTNKNSLVILISQSGETADTLACLRKVKEKGIDTLGIVNVVGSSIAREADSTIYIKAGPEISVATTKAYFAQVAILGLLALNIGYSREELSENQLEEILKKYSTFPEIIEQVINYEYSEISNSIYNYETCFFIGRLIDYSLCLEGCLKLKEISYINSIAYPAGELKHGTISLIEDDIPVFAVVTDKTIADKTISNIKEVKARGAKVILIITEDLDDDFDFTDYKIVIPNVNKILNPLLVTIPLQIISYEVAKLRKCDIDKPKNLAKSVTVE